MATSPRCAPRSARDLKGKVSPLLYCLGIGLSFVNQWAAIAVYVVVALMWLVPDRRVERTLAAARENGRGQPDGSDHEPVRSAWSRGKPPR